MNCIPAPCPLPLTRAGIGAAGDVGKGDRVRGVAHVLEGRAVSAHCGALRHDGAGARRHLSVSFRFDTRIRLFHVLAVNVSLLTFHPT